MPARTENVARWLHDSLLALPGVKAAPHPLGGVEYRLGAVELGHVHREELADVDAGPALADRVVGLGLAEVNPYAPPGWLSIDLHSRDGGRTALWLFSRNYRRARVAS
jgi:hypothetical protein